MVILMLYSDIPLYTGTYQIKHNRNIADFTFLFSEPDHR
jgi:hypothetical protein